MIEEHDMTSPNELVDRLVAIHGEQGLAPTRQDWDAILQCPPGEPLDILNLLHFKSRVESEGNVTSGMSAYAKYSAAVSPAFRRVGGKLLYFGKVNHIFGTVAGAEWDAAIVSRYPSPLALVEFWLDDEYVVGSAHRTNGVQASCVLVMSALRGA